MKFCNKCSTNKPRTLEFFHKKTEARDGLSAVCKTCRQEHHQKMKHTKLYVLRAERSRLNNRNRAILFYRESLSTEECVTCGEDNPNVLEYDHVYGIKKKGVYVLVNSGYSNVVIQKEMDKCEIVCRNCHMIRTRSGADSESPFLKSLYLYVNEIHENGISEFLTKTNARIKKAFSLYVRMNAECIDCRVEDFRVLEFDHVFGTKILCVNELCNDKRYTLSEVVDEIEKCEVVCRNCHKLRTVGRRK